MISRNQYHRIDTSKSRRGFKLMKKVKGAWVAAALLSSLALGVVSQQVEVLAQSSDMEQVWKSPLATSFDKKEALLALDEIKEEAQNALDKVTLKWEANSVDTIRQEMERQKDLGLTVYAIQWGDTLSAIAQASGRTVEDLALLNGIKDVDFILTGDILLLEGEFASSSMTMTSKGAEAIKKIDHPTNSKPSHPLVHGNNQAPSNTDRDNDPVVDPNQEGSDKDTNENTSEDPIKDDASNEDVLPETDTDKDDDQDSEEVIPPVTEDPSDKDEEDNSDQCVIPEKMPLPQNVAPVVNQPVVEVIGSKEVISGENHQEIQPSYDIALDTSEEKSQTVLEGNLIFVQQPKVDEEGNPVLDEEGNQIIENIPTPDRGPDIIETQTIKHEYYKTIPETTIIYDNTLAEGEVVVEKEGKEGSYTTIITIIDQDGEIITQSAELEDLVAAEPRVERRGSKLVKTIKTIKETTMTTRGIEYKENPNLPKGEEKVIEEGQDGENVRIYEVTFDAQGTEIHREETSKEETPVVNKIIEIGTYEEVITEEQKITELDFDVVQRENSELLVGESKVVQKGVKGKEVITEKVVTVNCEEIRREEIGREMIEPVDKIIEYGTKTVDRIETRDVIAYETEIRENPDLEKGIERVVREGKEGEMIVIEDVISIKGIEKERIEIERIVVTPAINKIIEVGSQERITKIEEKEAPVPYKVEKRFNKDLAKDEVKIIQKGKDGIKTIKEEVVYIQLSDGTLVEHQRQEIGSEITVEPLIEIIEVGTQETRVEIQSRIEKIPFEVEVIYDATLPEGHTQIVSEGSEGEKTIKEEITYINDKEISRQEISNTVTKEAENQITLMGTKIVEPATELEIFLEKASKFAEGFLNNLRDKNGLTTLINNEQLNSSAEKNAENLAQPGVPFGHQDDRRIAIEEGYVKDVKELINNPYAQANLYKMRLSTDPLTFFGSPEELGKRLILGWYGDINNRDSNGNINRGHRMVLLEKQFKHVGTGIHYDEVNKLLYASQYFGTPLAQATEIQFEENGQIKTKYVFKIPEGDAENPAPSYSPDGYMDYLNDELNRKNLSNDARNDILTLIEEEKHFKEKLN
ncbi:G5 domain-containing protein [Facklamia sp. P12934]|uniref:G5 domain-containing protein n=1 Tax=Facklamia sp. P12934 TaxID=3421948 RepID=UPI003D18316D